MSNFCISCGVAAQPGEAFCGSCGAPIPAASSAQTPAGNAPPQPTAHATPPPSAPPPPPPPPQPMAARAAATSSASAPAFLTGLFSIFIAPINAAISALVVFTTLFDGPEPLMPPDPPFRLLDASSVFAVDAVVAACALIGGIRLLTAGQGVGLLWFAHAWWLLSFLLLTGIGHGLGLAGYYDGDWSHLQALLLFGVLLYALGSGLCLVWLTGERARRALRT